MEKSDNIIMPEQTPTTHLEPRVAKLEAGLDILTRNVTDLTAAVRDNSVSMENKMERLTIAVTQAQAPRRTDWSTIIAGIMLVLAIGSAVFWPLNQTSQDNKIKAEQNHQLIIDHQKLDMHPVGLALVGRLETQLQEHQISNRREFENHMADAKEMHAVLEKHFEEMIVAQQKIHDLELAALKEKTQLHDDRLYGRVVKLEDKEAIEIEREKDELQMWRLKAMGIPVSPSVSTHTHEVIEQSTPTKK